MNELIFIAHSFIVSVSCIGALYLGKEALISFICLQTILANLFVTKQMTIFGLGATCSDVFIVGALFGLNLLQEFFDKKIAKKVVLINFFLLFFYLVMTQFHLLYIPNSFDSMHGHFKILLSYMPRLIFSSLGVFFLTQLLDIHLFSKLKELFPDRSPALRNFTALSISLLFDTIAFTFAGLYGIVGSVWQIIVISFAIKIITVLLSSPFTMLAKKLIRTKQS